MGAALSLVLLAAAISGCNQSPQSKTPATRPPSQASLQWQQIAEGFVQSYLQPSRSLPRKPANTSSTGSCRT